MTYEDALAYIERISWLGVKPGLSRITELLKKLGDPQNSLKFIHVAGTNGKGSTCAMIASILRAAGYRTGLFTSPYLQRFNERMQLDGIPISDDAFAAAISRIRPFADTMQDPCTEFELITAAAMLWFAQDGADVVVLETGLGGRLDATNIIKSSECDVITNIGLDHTTVLGDTLEQIAFEKAGIFKGAPIVSYMQEPAVAQVLAEAARAAHTKITVADFGRLSCVDNSIDGQLFHYGIGPQYELSLLGESQRNNAAVALEAVDVLRGRGWNISDEAAVYGFRSVKWPARFEVVSRRPIFVVDGGHNPQGIATVRDNLDTYFPNEWRVILFGVLADKDWDSMISQLAPKANAFVAVPPDSPRALSPRTLCSAVEKYGKHAIARRTVREGVETAINLAGKDGIVCAAGSLYMAGEIRGYFGLD